MSRGNAEGVAILLAAGAEREPRDPFDLAEALKGTDAYRRLKDVVRLRVLGPDQARQSVCGCHVPNSVLSD